MKKSNPSSNKVSKKIGKKSVKKVSKKSQTPDKNQFTDNPLEKTEGQILIYQTEGGGTKLEVQLEGETVWLTQKAMAELYQTTIPNINIHIQNIYNEGELSEDSVIKESLITASDSKKYRVKFYNLDMILSVGYRVKSHVATRFRQWATKRLREYIIKGFLLDDERLKNPHQPFDYFEELLRRIQDIRTSERRFYQKITDIYATSIDYDPTAQISLAFFKTVQNKLHWAITGQTAAEIIHNRADSSKTNMGLTNWRGEKIRKADVSIAKNYLNEKELKTLNNLIEQYLLFAEGQAMRRKPMSMKEWIQKLDAFLKVNERNILTHAGKIASDTAKELAEKEYNKFHLKKIKAEDKKEKAFDKFTKQISSYKKPIKKEKK